MTASNLSKIKPKFRTSGNITGNFGKTKVKAGSSLNDIGYSDKENIKVVRKSEYIDRLYKAMDTTTDPKIKKFCYLQIRDYMIQTGRWSSWLCGAYVLDYVEHICDPYIMPFSSKYANLGKTIKTRIPESCYHHVIYILDEYERIAELKGTIYLEQMQGRLEESLSNIKWLCAPHKMSVWGTHLGHISYMGHMEINV